MIVTARMALPPRQDMAAGTDSGSISTMEPIEKYRLPIQSGAY
jgi:hypothetical protein